jgi:hypothetical protein
MSAETTGVKPYTEISVVRVKQLLTENREFQGSGDGIERAPRVGDEGTIVLVYGTPATTGKAPGYEVECIARDGEFAGYTIWLATFLHDELELVTAYEDLHGDAKQ